MAVWQKGWQGGYQGTGIGYQGTLCSGAKAAPMSYAPVDDEEDGSSATEEGEFEEGEIQEKVERLSVEEQVKGRKERARRRKERDDDPEWKPELRGGKSLRSWAKS